jgi:hypothetical protein
VEGRVAVEGDLVVGVDVLGGVEPFDARPDPGQDGGSPPVSLAACQVFPDGIVSVPSRSQSRVSTAVA